MAFSYLRVSSARQAAEARTGLDRQADQFIPFCERHGLLPSLDPLVDAGISAYRGSNRRRGALGQFLGAVRDGVIPLGAVLVVEDLDRFSREAPSYAEEQLAEMFRLDLALGIVRDDVVVDRATYDREIGVRLQLLVRRDSAHDYSRKLSERVAAAHNRKRQREKAGEIATPTFRPPWLDYDRDSGAFVINEKASTYRRIVELCLQGYGQTRTAQIINGEGHRNTKGKIWSGPAVSRIFHDRRLIGEREVRDRDSGTTIVCGFFPAVISNADYSRMQALTMDRCSHKGRIGRGDRRRFLFQGVAFCPCGGRLMLQSRATPGREYSYIVCRAKEHQKLDPDGCRAPNVPYDEEWLLRAFMAQRWGQYFSRPEESRQRRQIEGELLTAETLLAQHRQHQQHAESNLAQLLTSGTLDADTAALLGRMASDARRQADATQDVVRVLQDRLQQAMARPSGKAIEKAIRERVAAFLAADREDPAERVRFNTWLSTLGLRIVLRKDGDRVEMSVEPLQKATYDGDGGVSVAGAEIATGSIPASR